MSLKLCPVGLKLCGMTQQLFRMCAVTFLFLSKKTEPTILWDTFSLR